MASDGHMTCYDVNSEFIALPHVTLAGLLAATLTQYSCHLPPGQGNTEEGSLHDILIHSSEVREEANIDCGRVRR